MLLSNEAYFVYFPPSLPSWIYYVINFRRLQPTVLHTDQHLKTLAVYILPHFVKVHLGMYFRVMPSMHLHTLEGHQDS